jgi:tetratricopeptide (TPR) repeat protein
VNSPGGRRTVAASALLIVLLGIAAYAGSLGGRFLYDDVPGIVENPSLRSLRTALAPPAGGLPESGRPLVNLSFALNYAAGGLRPWGYHAVNLLIHLLAGAVLFGIVRRTWPGERPAAFAAAVAALWVVHPLQAESVAYVSQRAEALLGLCCLLTLYGFIRGWLGLSWLACLAGMACKESMVAAPVVVLLYDRAFVAGSFRGALNRRGRYYLALAATWIPLALLVAGNASRGGTAGFGSGLPWWAYALTQVQAVAHYLRLAVWPRPLLGDYGRILAGAPAAVLGDGLVLAALGGLTLWGLAADPSRPENRRRAALGFLGGAFFLLLAPTSSVVPVATETIAEHRMYLPLAAVLTALVGAAAWAIPRLAPGWRPALRAGAGAAALLLALAGALGLTWRRVQAYHDSRSFWSDVAAKAPENAGARNNLGNLDADENRLGEAEAEYREALRIAPQYDDAQVGLGNVLARRGRPEEALPHYRLALRYRPDDPGILHAYAAALAAAGRGAEAAAAYRQLVGLRPDDAEAWYRLAVVLSATASPADALPAADAAARLRPGFADARVTRGDLLAQLGRREEAIAEYRAALRLAPDAPDVRNNLGGLLAEAGRLAEAEAEFEAALRSRPGYAEAARNLQQVRALEGKGAPR